MKTLHSGGTVNVLTFSDCVLYVVSNSARFLQYRIIVDLEDFLENVVQFAVTTVYLNFKARILGISCLMSAMLMV